MDFTIDDLKKLSPLKKAVIVAVLFLLLGYLYYMYFLQDVVDRQISARTKLAELESKIEVKEKAAAQIVRYRKEVEELTVSFNRALLKLPDEREIPELLASVVSDAKKAGISFLLFEPARPAPPAPPATPAAPAKPGGKGVPGKPPEPVKFYDDIPINMKITGTYHSVISFFAKMAELPRIVNVEDISISDPKPDIKRQMKVLVACKMKTYKFVDRKTK